jgi:predicted metal-dependent phosphoesterase TrpH
VPTTKLDLHLHTARHSPDSVIDPFELLDRARAAGLDGVVITEHDYLWPDAELEDLRRAAPDLVVLSGIEVAAADGDVLVYGVTDPFAVPRGIEWPDLMREVRRQGGACVMAHPYRWGQDVDALLKDERNRFDGIEAISNNMDADLRRRAADLHRRHPHFAALGNSDGHRPEVVGVCYTEFAATVRTNADLVAAIRGRKTTPRINERKSAADQRR